ncbi:MAG: ABC transporter permease subunit [Cardiobacteriaceae bacterium]|nr:ABC transporter permease subunit [Cardiobacteriaceae bacterium]
MTGFSALLEYREILLKGAIVSLELSFFGLLVALGFGLVACLCKMSKNPWLRFPALIYTSVGRGIPDLIQLFLAFYGGQYLLNLLVETFHWQHIDMDPLVTGIVIIGFVMGAYMAESFRGGFLAIPKGQIEAARAYGFSSRTIFWRISWPQMLRYALPSLGNNWLVLMKNTALVSIIGLQDIVRLASAGARTAQKKDIFAGFWFYGAMAAFFLALTTISIIILWWLRRRYSAGFNAQR